jgi:hypothetical protein
MRLDDLARRVSHEAELLGIVVWGQKVNARLTKRFPQNNREVHASVRNVFNHSVALVERRLPTTVHIINGHTG